MIYFESPKRIFKIEVQHYQFGNELCKTSWLYSSQPEMGAHHILTLHLCTNHRLTGLKDS